LECSTMFYNGSGYHTIQGIADQHRPLSHYATVSDDVIGISAAATDTLFLLFHTAAGKDLLCRQKVAPGLVEELRHLGLSSIANVLAAIKLAKHHRYGSDDVIVTVATDGGEMYTSEIGKFEQRDHPRGFDSQVAAAAQARYLAGADTEHVLELTEVDKRRIFNLGYFTWVEQQGIDFDLFERRRQQSWW